MDTATFGMGTYMLGFNYLTSKFATWVVSLVEVCVLRNSNLVFKMRRFYDSTSKTS